MFVVPPLGGVSGSFSDHFFISIPEGLQVDINQC